MWIKHKSNNYVIDYAIIELQVQQNKCNNQCFEIQHLVTHIFAPFHLSPALIHLIQLPKSFLIPNQLMS